MASVQLARRDFMRLTLKQAWVSQRGSFPSKEPKLPPHKQLSRGCQHQAPEGGTTPALPRS